MDNNENKNVVEEIVDDLKEKAEGIDKAIEGTTNTKITEIKNKTIEALNMASKKVIEVANEMADSEEIAKSADYIKNKAKELYENALQKIEEIKKDEQVNNAINTAGEYLNEASKKIEESEVYQNVKETIDNFTNKPEVKETIDKARYGTVDLAEKALETLKQWLDSEDK